MYDIIGNHRVDWITYIILSHHLCQHNPCVILFLSEQYALVRFDANMKLKCLSKNKSCCCYSLEHGAIIIGITFMISSSVALLCEIGMLAEWNDIKHNFNDKRMRKFVHPFLIVSMVLSAVYIIFSILLLNGIKKVN